MSELLLAYTWYQFLNLPDKPGETGWLIFCLFGNVTFSTRFFLQWIQSERAKESKIPVIFWWQSIAGTLILLTYFIHRHDPVGILSYVVNVIPYTRNLMLVYRKRQRDAVATTSGVVPPK